MGGIFFVNEKWYFCYRKGIFEINGKVCVLSVGVKYVLIKFDICFIYCFKYKKNWIS